MTHPNTHIAIPEADRLVHIIDFIDMLIINGLFSMNNRGNKDIKGGKNGIWESGRKSSTPGGDGEQAQRTAGGNPADEASLGTVEHLPA